MISSKKKCTDACSNIFSVVFESYSIACHASDKPTLVKSEHQPLVVLFISVLFFHAVPRSGSLIHIKDSMFQILCTEVNS